MNAITVENYLQALQTAEKRWFDNRKPETIKKGITVSGDLIDARKWLSAHTVAFINANLAGMQMKPAQYLDAVANQLGVKANMRVIEFFNALHAGEYRKLDGVTTLDVLSCAYAGAKTRDALHFVATGKGNESTSDEVKGIALVRKMQRALGIVGSSTEPTQHSRSFGNNGFCKFINLAYMGRGEHGEKEFQVNQDNVIFSLLTSMIEKASDTTLAMVKGGTDSGKKTRTKK